MVKNDVKILEIAKKLRGLQTVSTISKNLNVTRKTAVNYAWNLRKAGYLTSTGGGRNIKFYRISPLKFKKRDGYSLYELINKYSRIKLNISQDYIIHLKKEPSPEEILVRAVSSKEFRLMLASLELFNKINNWSKLKKLAEKYKIGRNVGALYDVARKCIKVRRMDERTRNALLKSNGKKFLFDYKIKSKSFQDVEKKWRVFIPLNKQDMEIYEEWSR